MSERLFQEKETNQIWNTISIVSIFQLITFHVLAANFNIIFDTPFAVDTNESHKGQKSRQSH